jgi:hypothetical protein
MQTTSTNYDSRSNPVLPLANQYHQTDYLRIIDLESLLTGLMRHGLDHVHNLGFPYFNPENCCSVSGCCSVTSEPFIAERRSNFIFLVQVNKYWINAIRAMSIIQHLYFMLTKAL